MRYMLKRMAERGKNVINEGLQPSCPSRRGVGQGVEKSGSDQQSHFFKKQLKIGDEIRRMRTTEERIIQT